MQVAKRGRGTVVSNSFLGMTLLQSSWRSARKLAKYVAPLEVAPFAKTRTSANETSTYCFEYQDVLNECCPKFCNFCTVEAPTNLTGNASYPPTASPSRAPTVEPSQAPTVEPSQAPSWLRDVPLTEQLLSQCGMSKQSVVEADLLTLPGKVRENTGELAVRLRGQITAVMNESLIVKRGTFLFVDGGGYQIEFAAQAQFIVEDSGRLCLANLALPADAPAIQMGTEDKQVSNSTTLHVAFVVVGGKDQC